LSVEIEIELRTLRLSPDLGLVIPVIRSETENRSLRNSQVKFCEIKVNEVWVVRWTDTSINLVILGRCLHDKSAKEHEINYR